MECRNGLGFTLVQVSNLRGFLGTINIDKKFENTEQEVVGNERIDKSVLPITRHNESTENSRITVAHRAEFTIVH